ncbi:MAG: hypothetical protein SGARI_004873 [Bacillariaceae sp.]
MTIREPIDNETSNDNYIEAAKKQRTSIQDLALEVQRVRDEAIQEAELRRNDMEALKENREPFDMDQALSKAEEGYLLNNLQRQTNEPAQSLPSPSPSFVLLEGVAKDDPRLPDYIRKLLDTSMSPDERNNLVYTNPPYDEAFGNGPNTYYPDHIPLPGYCHWLVSILCLALGGVILSGEIKTHKGPMDAVTAAVVLALICVAPGLWCLWWGRRSHLKRKDLFGYYTIGTAALVDYNEKSGIWVFPVDHIVSMYSKTTGSGGERTTSKHLIYRTSLGEETLGTNEETSIRWWWCGRKHNKDQRKITLDGTRNGDHLIYWWKHKVQGVPTWSELQAQNTKTDAILADR